MLISVTRISIFNNQNQYLIYLPIVFSVSYEVIRELDKD